MTKSRREKKEPFKIDFFTHSTKSQKEIAKELFAPIGKGGSITLPQHSKGKRSRKGKEKEVRNENTLPDDMHFSSRQLVTLFLKPKFAVSYAFHQHRPKIDFTLKTLSVENAWTACQIE